MKADITGISDEKGQQAGQNSREDSPGVRFGWNGSSGVIWFCIHSNLLRFDLGLEVGVRGRVAHRVRLTQNEWRKRREMFLIRSYRFQFRFYELRSNFSIRRARRKKTKTNSLIDCHGTS